jgi:hypothetical protein
MADIVIDNGGDVEFVINDDASANAGNYLRVQRYSTPETIFQVDEDYTVTVTNSIRRNGAVEVDMDAPGYPTLCEFQREGVTRLLLDYTTAGNELTFETPSSADSRLVIRCASAACSAVLDSNGSGDGYLRVRAASGSDVWRVSRTSTVEWLDASADVQCDVSYSSVAATATFRVGVETATRGVVAVHRSASGKFGGVRPGVVEIQREDGLMGFLWVDDSGSLRCSVIDPRTTPSTGNTVCSQS